MTGSDRWTCALIIAASALVAYNPGRDGDLDFHHEGERLAAVDALRAGALPFRDVYVAHGLGEDVLKPLFACRLLGESVASLRTLGSNAYVSRGLLPPLGVVACLVAVAALVHRPRYVLLAGVLVLVTWCEPNDRHALGLLGLGAVAAGARTTRPGWLFLGGVLAALAALYSLEVGGYLLAAALSWAVLDPLVMDGDGRARGAAVWTRAAWLLAGAVAGALPFIAWCVGHGILDDFLHNAYIQVFLRREVFPARPYPRPAWTTEGLGASALAVGRTVSLFWAPPLVAGTMLVSTWVFRRTLPAGARSLILLSSSLALFFWLSVLGRPDIWHVAYAVPALLPALVTFACLFRPEVPAARTALLALMGLSTAGLVLAGRGGILGRRLFGEAPFLPDIYRTSTQDLVPCPLDRCGAIRVEPRQQEAAGRWLGAIRRLSAPDDTILDLSDNALLYFLSGRRSPTRFHLRAYWGPSPELQREALGEILARPRLPACVITVPRPPQSLDGIERWLRSAYVMDEDTGELQFWRPR